MPKSRPGSGEQGQRFFEREQALNKAYREGNLEREDWQKETVKLHKEMSAAFNMPPCTCFSCSEQRSKGNA